MRALSPTSPLLYVYLVSRAYRMFLSLGLRHLPVLDEDGSLAGILTRKDLIAHAEWCELNTDIR